MIVNLRYSLEGLNGSDDGGSLTREYSRLSILVPIMNYSLNDRYYLSGHSLLPEKTNKKE